MTDELYRRCPDCLDSDPGAPCPTCGGERYVPAPPEQPDIAVRFASTP